MNANGLYSGVEGYVIPGTNSGVGGGVANGVYREPNRIRTDLQVVTNGLVYYLDATNYSSYPRSGTTWTDLTRSGNNGTLTNNPVFSSTNGGNIVFNGVNSFVRVSSTSITNLVNNLSVEIWYRGLNPQLFYSRYPAGGFMIGSFGTSTQWKASKYGVVDSFIGTVPTDSNWHQVVYVYTSILNLGISIYVDGKLNAVDLNSTNISVPSSGFFDIGVAEYGNFNGSISSVKIYNKPLTAAEVSQNYLAVKWRYGL